MRIYCTSFSANAVKCALLLYLLNEVFPYPGEECSSEYDCEGNSVCFDSVCRCVEGMITQTHFCVDPTWSTTQSASIRQIMARLININEASTTSPNEVTTQVFQASSIIGLAGQKCGMGGLCRSMTTCKQGICTCHPGFRALFGECLRNHEENRVPVPRMIRPKWTAQNG